MIDIDKILKERSKDPRNTKKNSLMFHTLTLTAYMSLIMKNIKEKDPSFSMRKNVKKINEMLKLGIK